MMFGKVIVFLITMAIAKHHHQRNDDLNSVDPFFNNVYVTIHSIMDNLFESISVTTNFTKAFNTKLLLTMHYHLSNIADQNLNVFNEIQNLIKQDSNEAAKLVSLDTTVKDVLNENNYDAYGAFKEASKRKKKSNDEEQAMDLIDLPEFDKSAEYKEIIFRILTNINNHTLRNFFKKSSKHRIAVPSRKNLKVWEGPRSTELESFNTRRLFGGTKAHVNQFPFLVSIHILGEFACTGSIIHRDLIITAASCLQIAYQQDYLKNNLKAIYVRLGSDYTTRGGETIPVQNLYLHPAYNPETLSNNIAILSLEKRNRFSRQQKRIRRILYDKSEEKITNNTHRILTLGWVDTEKGQEIQKDPHLSMDFLNLLPVEKCVQKYSVDFISNNNFCVGVENSSRGACPGDLGGPGIVDAVLMGIVSFGDSECGANNSLTVFTKLGHYAEWIENILSMHKNASRIYKNHNDTRRISNSFGFIHLNMTPLQKIRLRNHAVNYPEEVKVLREILLDLVKADNNLTDDVIYGDLSDDFTKTIKRETGTPGKIKAITKKIKTHKHRIPFTKATTTTPVISIISHSIDSFLKSILPSDGFKPALRMLKSSDHESENEDNANEYTDNYEQSSNEYHGLSIEIPSTQKILPKKKKNLHTTKESIKTKASSKVTKSIFIRNQENTKAKHKPVKIKGKSSKHGHAELVQLDLDDIAPSSKDTDESDSVKTDSDVKMDYKFSDNSETDSNEESKHADSDEMQNSFEAKWTTVQEETFQGTRINYDIDQDANRNSFGNEKFILRNQVPRQKLLQSKKVRGRPMVTRPFFLELDSDFSSSDSKQNNQPSTKPKEKAKKRFLSSFILAL
ncbi:hypothetical protein HF086_010185 [Spodoptera exigua]|uniref:Peptidase S1 domain-containing protein n=1 Tax=Spodoptera exigua TaxID=7107 RepID=A0A922MZ86_SPOEX|nr:hypothetical protein HF086_010185 [Spodoptera exigua]